MVTWPALPRRQNSAYGFGETRVVALTLLWPMELASIVPERSQSMFFFCPAKIEATDATKKNPRQFTRLGSTELLPQLRLLAGRQGVGGWGCRPAGLMQFK